jgi:flagellar hook assembly protein FlgD
VSPNPFNPSGVLTFRTYLAGPVSVHMFDLHGRLVRTLAVIPSLAAGPHELRVDGQDDRGRAMASGVYFYRIQSRDGTTVGRVAILK